MMVRHGVDAQHDDLAPARLRDRVLAIPLIGWSVIAAITLFVGGIAVRSLVALGQGDFLPKANAAATSHSEAGRVTT